MAAGIRTLRIRFTGDSKGLVIATGAAETAVDRLQDKINKGFPRATKAAAKLALVVGNVGTALQIAAGASAAFATAAGVLVGLPALGAAAAVALAAVKLGADGAARSMERFGQQIAPIKEAVSASFEKALNPAVDQAAKILANLQTPMQAIVTQLGGIATQAANTAALPENMSLLNTVGLNTSRMLGNLKAAVAPLTQAFFDLVSVAAPGIANIGTNAAETAQKWADMIRAARDDGSLAQRLQGAQDALRAFWETLKDIAAIIGSVFQGLSEGAGGLTGVFGPAIQSIRDFVESAQGQELLRTLGMVIAQIGDAVSAVLMPALRAVSPLLGPLAMLFGAIVEQVSLLLVPLIDFLAPALSALAGFIQANVDWLAPLAIAIGAATAAMWLFNIALNANPIVLIVVLIAGLVAAIIGLWTHFETFRNIVTAVWNAVRNAIGAAVQWVIDRWNGLMGFFRGIPGFFRDIGQGIADGITAGFKAAVNFIIGIINGLISGINVLITGINHVNPFDDIPHIPKIPRLARGGLITAGGLAVVGEQGREIVALPTGAQVIPNGPTEALLGGTPEIRVFIGDQELRGMVRTEITESNRTLRRSVLAGAGGAR